MRILLGHPMSDQQTGWYIWRALIQLGHEIVGVHDSICEHPDTFLQMAKDTRPDLIFTAKVNNYEAIAEELSKKSLLFFWSYDVRDDIDIWLQDTKNLYKYSHFFFTIGQSDVYKYRKLGLSKCMWLPEGIDPKTVYRPEIINFKDHFNYDCDVAFAGSVGPVHDGGRRRELIKQLETLNFLSSMPINFTHFTDVVNDEHSKLVNCAKINIGNSGWPQIEGSMSARDYRIMGAGGFLLTNKVRGIEDWFEIGEMCDVYETPDECVEKIKYYLNKDHLRSAMSKYAMKIVHEKHKFSDRLETVIQIAENYHG